MPSFVVLALEPVAVALPSDVFELGLQRFVRGLWKGYAEATVAQVDVPAANLRPLAESFEEARLLAAAVLLDLYADHGLQPFEPCFASDEYGCRLFLPPVCEEHPNGDLLVDGVHRVLAARRSHTQRLTVIRLAHVASPPPRAAADWGLLRGYTRPRSLHEVMGDYSHALFRPVAAGLSRLTFATRAQALATVGSW